MSTRSWKLREWTANGGRENDHFFGSRRALLRFVGKRPGRYDVHVYEFHGPVALDRWHYALVYSSQQTAAPIKRNALPISSLKLSY
jgi:hypothetical protein